MRTLELIYYPKNNEVRKKHGWGFALYRQEEFREGEGHFRMIPHQRDLEFTGWLRSWGHIVPDDVDTAVFEITDELALMLMEEWTA